MEIKIFDEITVFYVEDDEDDRMIFEDMLAEVAPKANLQMFKNGIDLLYAVKNPPPVPAIVFVDLNLPGITGYEVLKEIKASNAFSRLPMVVFSTSDSEVSFEESRKNGASFYIVKSTDVTHFKQSLYIALTTDWSTHKLSKEEFVYQAD